MPWITLRELLNKAAPPFTALLCVISLSKSLPETNIFLAKSFQTNPTTILLVEMVMIMIQFPPYDVTQLAKTAPCYEKGKTAHEHSSHVIFPIEKLLKQKHTSGESFAEASQRFCSKDGEKALLALREKLSLNVHRVAMLEFIVSPTVAFEKNSFESRFVIHSEPHSEMKTPLHNEIFSWKNFELLQHPTEPGKSMHQSDKSQSKSQSQPPLWI